MAAESLLTPVTLSLAPALSVGTRRDLGDKANSIRTRKQADLEAGLPQANRCRLSVAPSLTTSAESALTTAPTFRELLTEMVGEYGALRPSRIQSWREIAFPIISMLQARDRTCSERLRAEATTSLGIMRT